MRKGATAGLPQKMESDSHLWGQSYVDTICTDACVYVVNKQYEFLEFVFDPVYVDLQYDEISLTFSAGSV